MSSPFVFALVPILQFVGGILAQDDSVGVVNPCVDFYTYACKVRNATEEPDISDSKHQFKQFVENYPLKVEKLSDVEDKFYKFRKYCSQPTLEDGKNFLKNYNPSIGGWPAFDKNWNSEKFDLQSAVAELQSALFPTFFTIRLRNEPSDFKNFIQVKLTISDRLYSESFKQIMMQELSNIMDNVDEVISDSLIVEGLYVAEKNSTNEDVMTDYEGLKKEIPEIDWDQLFETVCGQKVPGSFPVKIEEFGLMKRLTPKMFEVNPKVMANYLFYRLVDFFPELDEDMSTELFQIVIYRMVIKQHYSGETKDVVRSMLVSFLKTLTKSGNQFDPEHEYNIENLIHEFVTEEIMPDTDDSFLDNYYRDVRVSENDCYSTAIQLLKAFNKIKSRLFFKRKIDPLRHISFELINTISNRLPLVLDKSSAIQFEVLTWDLFESNLLTYWDNKESFTSMQKCMEMQVDDKVAKHEIKEFLKLQIFTRAYFDWLSGKVNLMEVEERKHNNSSKMIFLERLILRYCHEKTSQEKNKISLLFANLGNFSKVYNCPVGSRLNPTPKCNII